jgi:hypothetical protein
MVLWNVFQEFRRFMVHPGRFGGNIVIFLCQFEARHTVKHNALVIRRDADGLIARKRK